MGWDAMLKKTVDGGPHGGPRDGGPHQGPCNVPNVRLWDEGWRLHDQSTICKGQQGAGGEYNPVQPKTYIRDWDANNLYGWAMSQIIPYGKFDWLGPSELQHFKWQQLPDNDYYGYFVECYLEYPPELHEAHNDYALAPERVGIQVDMLSDANLAISRHYARSRAA